MRKLFSIFLILFIGFLTWDTWALSPSILTGMSRSLDTTTTTTTTTSSTTTTTLAGDDCTADNLVYSSHFEGTGNSSTAFDVTSGSPAGCSDDASKDITFYNSAVINTDHPTDGTSAFWRSLTTDYATFPITGIAADEGVSFEFTFRYESWASNGTIIKIGDADSTDYISVQMGSTADSIKVSLYANGALSGSAALTGYNLQANTDYTIRIRTRHGSTDPWVEVTVDGALDAIDTDNPANFTDVLTIGQFGSTSTYSHDMAIDQFKIWNVWKTGDTWGD